MEEPRLRFCVSAEAKRRGVSLGIPREADAGFDLPSLEEVEIAPGAGALIRTGIHLAIPLHHVGLIRDRSSVALRGGACTAGVIDSSYRGEVKVLMHNLGPEPLVFRPGDRVAQCIVVRHLPGEGVEEAPTLEALGTTARGAGGFGSTGR